MSAFLGGILWLSIIVGIPTATFILMMKNWKKQPQAET